MDYSKIFNDLALFESTTVIIGGILIYVAYKLLSKIISVMILVAMIAIMYWGTMYPQKASQLFHSLSLLN
jgi:hypothetical protein